MDALPDGLLLKILSFLNLNDLIDCVRHTCMRWHALSYDFSLWRVLHLVSDKPPSCGERALILEVADIVEELTLEQIFVHDEKAISLYNILGPTLHCSNLKRLHLIRMKITKDQLSSLVADYHFLEELSIIDWLSTGCLVNHVQYLKHLSRLRHLKVTENYGTSADFKEDLSANMQHLVTLTLDGVDIYHDAIGMLLKTASGLTKLHLRNSTMRRDVVLQDSIPDCTHLETLDIGQSSFDDEWLMWIAARCPKLRSLSIHFCSNISDKSVVFVSSVCKQLQCLIARTSLNAQNENAGPKISDNGLKNIFGNCQHLRKLDINNHIAIGDISISHLAKCCPNIEDLDLSKSKVTDESIISLSRFSSKIRVLDISRCCSITGASISKLVTHCTRLSSLSLFGCSGIKDINFDEFYQTCAKPQTMVTCNSNEVCTKKAHGSMISDESSFGIDPNITIEHACCHEKIPDKSGLSDLNLSHTSITAESLLQVAVHCPNLVVLAIKNCCLVTDGTMLSVVQWCRQLRTLHLSGWYGHQRMILSNLSLYAIAEFGENIKHLSIDFNDLVTIKGIEKVIVGCKLLESFSCSVSRAFSGTKNDISQLKAVIADRYKECAVKEVHYLGEPQKRRELCVLLNPSQ